MKVALCDDEAAQREWLQQQVKRFFQARKQPCELLSYQSGEELLHQLPFHPELDIALLDISMAGMNGIELAKKLRKTHEELAIIFVTGVTDYIFEGFALEAVNYLLKPVEEEKLNACLKKACDRCAQKLLTLQTGREVLRLRLSDILHIESEGHYLRIVSAQRSYRVKKSMKELEECLPASRFVKVRRTDIIHLQAVDCLTSKEVLLADGARIPLPKGSYRDLSEAFLRYCREEDGES